MLRDVYEYWTVRQGYSGEIMPRLDRDLLKEDIGEPFTDALMLFLAAHYKYNDQEQPATELEKLDLVEVMKSAILVFGEDFPRFAFVDSLSALTAGVATGRTRISPRQNAQINLHGFHNWAE